MEYIYRFEISDTVGTRCPKSLRQGFLTGLEDVGLDPGEEKGLYDLFDDLPAPPPIIGPSCWFTEAGLRRFSDAVDVVANVISCQQWQMFASVMEVDRKKVLYRDEWQVVLPSYYVEMQRPDFFAVSYAREIIGQNKKGAKYMTRGWALVTHDGGTVAESVYLSSSAYPSYYGIQFFDVICNGEDIATLGDRFSEVSEPMHAALSEFRFTRESGRKASDFDDYVYIYDTRKDILTILHYGQMALRLAVKCNPEFGRFVLTNMESLCQTAITDPETLVERNMDEYKALRTVLRTAASVDALRRWQEEGPKVSISSSRGRILTGHGFGEDLDFFWGSYINIWSGDTGNWTYRAFVLRLEPVKTRHGERYVDCKQFLLRIQTPWGVVAINPKLVGRREGEAKIIQFVNENALYLGAAYAAIKLTENTHDRVVQLLEAHNTQDNIKEARRCISKAVSELESLLNGVPEFIPGLDAKKIAAHLYAVVEYAMSK